MKPSFYLAPALLAALVACGGGSADAGDAPPEDPVFALPDSAVTDWTPPGEGGWARRWTERLASGGKEPIRFAKQRLLELDDAARPELEAALRAGMHEARMFGQLVSLCDLLGAVGDADSARLLLEAVEVHRTPVVRTSAFEAVAQIAPREEDIAERLVALLDTVVDAAPRGALFGALAQTASPPATRALERIILQWLEGAPGNDGQVAFNALLASDESPALAEVLARLDPELPPYPRLQAIALRVQMGERGLAEVARGYLDPVVYPSAATRELALGVLAAHGDWEPVVAAGDEPVREIRLAVISLLRREDARQAGVGEDLLDLYTQDPDLDVAANALVALVERGQRNRLDPFLRLLQGFPTAAGSMQALVLLSKPEVEEPRAAGILIDRWPYCDVPSRLDVTSALVRAGTEDAARFLAQVARDEAETFEVRRKAATMLANFGPVAVGLLLEVWRAAPTPETASWVVPGLGRYPEDSRVPEFLLQLAGDPEVPDLARRQTIDLLPRVLGADALDVLLALRESTARSDVRRYLDWMLASYF